MRTTPCCVALLVLCGWLAVCDLDPFGFTRKKIGSGYCLFVGERQHEFAVLAPGSSSGSTIAQIGWRKPYIIAHSDEGDQRWEVFDTATKTSRLVTTQQLRTD